MTFYTGQSSEQPLASEENCGHYYIRKDISYNEEYNTYTYQEAYVTEEEYELYILNQRQLEALEAIAELYEMRLP